MRVLTVREAADYFGRPTQTIYTWIRRGTVTAVRVDGRIWVDPKDVLHAHTRRAAALAQTPIVRVE